MQVNVTSMSRAGVAMACLVWLALPSGAGTTTGAAQTLKPGAVQKMDLAGQLAAGNLRAVNREVSPLEGTPGAVRVSQKQSDGVIWIGGTDFADGTIEVDVRGRDVPQQSFVGIAFHRQDDSAYDVVYLRPFNFRTDDPVRRQNAVQYMSVPGFGWARLRKEFPSEFENPVDASIDPTGWVSLRVVVAGRSVQVYVGTGTSPTLEVQKLGRHHQGLVGLWTGNNSDGAFANLRIIPSKR